MAWYIPMVISAVGSAVNYSSQNKQNSNQAAWNRYNAHMSYNADMANIGAMGKIGAMNASAQMAAGRINAQLERSAGEINARAIEMTTAYNASLINLTTAYNTTLLDDEIAMMWEAANLDILHLENQRAVEKGAIEGQQAGSGVVMGQDSAEDVIVSQQTQAALDTFVVRHNANREAEKIRIQIDENIFNGTLAWQQTMFQGSMDALMTRTNAELRAQGALANAAIGAAATMAETGINQAAARQSARYRLDAGLAGATMQYNQNKTTIKNNFVNGLFGAGISGAQNYYMMKQPNLTNIFKSSTSAPRSTASRSATTLARQSHPSWERVLQGQLSTPGTTLM